MTSRYQRELEALDTVYAAARSLDVADLATVIEHHIDYPLMAIGSGGSYSTASFAAGLHEHRTGRLARAATPLDFLNTHNIEAGIVCFSASGCNRDIGVAYKEAAQRENGPVSALVLALDSPLHALCNKYAYTTVASFYDETFKDGFLAVASMVASALALVRAYDHVLGASIALPKTLVELCEETLGQSLYANLVDKTMPVMKKAVVSVLYDPSLKATAVDLESRFVEAALGPLHTADFRNFGHGRHFWIAKRAEDTGLLALSSNETQLLADRTLGLIPEKVERVRIDFTGSFELKALSGLVVSLFISDAAGRVVKIDPGKPSVPLFGRTIYRLGPRSLRRTLAEVNKAAAVRRKVRAVGRGLRKPREHFETAYEAVHDRLFDIEVNAVVFDYDGTLCDPEKRFNPLPARMGKALIHLWGSGVRIGIATGRGPSAGRAIRAALPEAAWADVTIGYYNGAVVTKLSDDRDPIVDAAMADALSTAVRQDNLFADTDIRENAAQLTIRTDNPHFISTAINRIHTILRETGTAARVCVSSHSIDVVRGGASKRSVVEAMSTGVDDGIVLRIGDKGAWPGNDADLLDSVYGLSVDLVSDHSEHCWNLAPAGILGVQATRYYLGKIYIGGGCARLRLRRSDRGVGVET